MENVGSTKLKTSLNAYLKQVQKGLGFIILDRGRPVAKLVPLGKDETSDPDEIIASLASSGLLDLKDVSLQGQLKSNAVKPVKLNNISAAEMLLKDRS